MALRARHSEGQESHCDWREASRSYSVNKMNDWRRKIEERKREKVKRKKGSVKEMGKKKEVKRRKQRETGGWIQGQTKEERGEEEGVK